MAWGASCRRCQDGVHVGWTRDVAGRPLERHTWRADRFAGGPEGGLTEALDARSYQWRGADQIAAIINPSSGPTFYDHDDRGRLVRERRPGQGAVVERAMDAVGNVYRTGDGRDRRYGPGGRLLEADGVRYEHDEDGNQTRRELPDGSAWAYAWNGSGMLREVTRPDGERVRFEYDAFARRTAKRVVRVGEDGTETVQAEHRFVWDGHTVLHELDSEAGLTTWYWEPQTFTPVAKEQNGRKWSVASDHLGTPTEMYDELGQLAWKMQLDVFGVPSVEEGAAQDCPWRWPGQYEDAETGDYYNRWRYYSTHEARYGQTDPIRLTGGLNLTAYVDDPAVLSDPLGLEDRMPTWMPTRQGYQRQHLIPYSLRNHPVFAASGRDINSATNMMYLPVAPGIHPNPNIGLHRGWTVQHAAYNADVGTMLDNLKVALDAGHISPSQLDEAIRDLQHELRSDLNAGRRTCA